MITVHLPIDLAEEFKTAAVLTTDAQDLRDLMDQLDHMRPGVAGWLLEADGRFRQHLSVFISGRRLETRSPASAPLHEGADVWILRAVSGG
jgi:molybdopterin synthase sulfur carrier subunit